MLPNIHVLEILLFAISYYTNYVKCHMALITCLSLSESNYFNFGSINLQYLLSLWVTS